MREITHFQIENIVVSYLTEDTMVPLAYVVNDVVDRITTDFSHMSQVAMRQMYALAWNLVRDYAKLAVKNAFAHPAQHSTKEFPVICFDGLDLIQKQFAPSNTAEETAMYMRSLKDYQSSEYRKHAASHCEL